jgi:hypothetical protein
MKNEVKEALNIIFSVVELAQSEGLIKSTSNAAIVNNAMLVVNTFTEETLKLTEEKKLKKVEEVKE